MVRRLAAVLAALAMSAFTVGVALAVTEPLHQGTPIAWNDPSVEVECEEGDNVPSGMVLWHFVAHTTTSDFTLDATFADGTIVTDKAPAAIGPWRPCRWSSPRWIPR